MDHFLYDEKRCAPSRCGCEKMRKALGMVGCALLLTLAVGKAAALQTQPVFFSMLFPQLMPGAMWDSAPMEEEAHLWDALFGKAVWL